jgi:hypothetical protein
LNVEIERQERHMSAIRPSGSFARAVLTSALLLLAAVASADDQQYPQVSPDGLQLRKTLQHGAVYVKPGAEFSTYKSIGLLQCYVQFAKDWARDYNQQNEMNLGAQVTPADETRMKNELSLEFNKVFVEVLGQNGDFQIATSQGPGVLMLRPSLLNLIVTAPDPNMAAPGVDVVASAGQVTLYLELWDGGTSTLLARVIDTQADNSSGGMAEQANSVTNKVAADIILKHWADRLRGALDAARSAPSVSP